MLVVVASYACAEQYAKQFDVCIQIVRLDCWISRQHLVQYFSEHISVIFLCFLKSDCIVHAVGGGNSTLSSYRLIL